MCIAADADFRQEPKGNLTTVFTLMSMGPVSGVIWGKNGSKASGSRLEVQFIHGLLGHPLHRQHGDIIRSGRFFHKIEYLLPNLLEEFLGRGHWLGQDSFHPMAGK